MTITVTWYLAETLVNTSHKRGLRASVYDLAGKNGAFHSNIEKTSITYNGDQTILNIRVLFSQPSQCGIFQTKLEEMVKRIFDIESVIQHNRVYEEVIWSSSLQAVLASDYVSTDNPDSDQYLIARHLTLLISISQCSLGFGKMLPCLASMVVARASAVI